MNYHDKQTSYAAPLFHCRIAQCTKRVDLAAKHIVSVELSVQNASTKVDERTLTTKQTLRRLNFCIDHRDVKI
jgi:hypothetical protein